MKPPSPESVAQLFNSALGDSAHEMDKEAEVSALREIYSAYQRNPLFLDARHPKGDGNTLLGRAARKQSLFLMRELLELGANPNARNAVGQTPLMFSALVDQLEAIELLLAHGARADLRDQRGKGPLLSALTTHRHSEPVIRRLLEAGADPLEVDNEGQRPLHRLLEYKNSSLELVKLLSQGVPSEVLNQPVTPAGLNVVHMVCGTTVAPVLQHLIDQGADLHHQTWTGQTAIHTMVDNGFQANEIKVLIQLGLDVNAQDVVGRTALHLACAKPSSHVILIKDLLALGAEPYMPDATGMTSAELLINAAKTDKKNRDQLKELVDFFQAHQALVAIEDVQIRSADHLKPL